MRVILALVLLGWIGRAVFPHADWLGDQPQAILRGQIWRLVSYPFAAPFTLGHLLLTLTFIPFACSSERSLGTVRFRRLFWSATLLASLLGLAQSFWARPLALGGLAAPTVAVLTASCLLHRGQRVYLFGVLPIPSEYLLPLGLLVLCASAPLQAYLPLLSGAGLAYLMVRRNFMMQTEMFRRPAGGRRKSRLSEEFSGPKVTPIRPDLQRTPLSEVEARVDQILDKLRHEGMAALTPQEKEVLDSHSKRLRHGDERM